MMTLSESRFIGMSRMGKHLGLHIPFVMLSAAKHLGYEFRNEILHFAVAPFRMTLRSLP